MLKHLGKVQEDPPVTLPVVRKECPFGAIEWGAGCNTNMTMREVQG